MSRRSTRNREGILVCPESWRYREEAKPLHCLDRFEDETL